MKKTLLIATCVMFSSIATHAQPWMAKFGNGPVKLEDVIKDHEENPGNYSQEEEHEMRQQGQRMEEKGDYQFDRWVWYWKQHLDENGYMVNGAKTWEEWKKYTEAHNVAHKGLAKTTSTDPSNWIAQGPFTSPGQDHGIGRINVMAFHPTDSNTFWIGSAGGGAWKTTNGGSTWAAVYTKLPVLSVSDIDFNPLNPNTVYVCTGDRDAGDTYSVGVLKSYDGGVTWDTTGIQWSANGTNLANCLVINPLDTNTILLAASDGIHRSFDGGITWTTVQGGGFKEIMYCPGDTTVLIAAGGSQIYRSTNGGTTWQSVTTMTGVGRITFDICTNSPSVVIAITSSTSNTLEGIYKSTDTGHTFIKVFDAVGDCSKNLLSGDQQPTTSSCDGQGWYDLSIAVNPSNPSEVIVGGVNAWYSTNSGTSWGLANQWFGLISSIATVHADKHYMKYHPLRSNVLYECGDGGIHSTKYPLGQWTDITNGLNITEFYRVAVSNVTNFAIGGAQDNGCKKIDNGASMELTGGDGMEVQMDYNDPNTMYTASQYGYINISSNGGANFSPISNNIPGTPQGDWITPYVLHPQLSNTIYAGYKNLFISPDQGQTWTSMSPAFSGLIDRIAVASSNPNYIYILNSTGSSLRYTPDNGTTWNTIPASSGITDVIVNPWDENIIWVTYGGYTASKKVSSYTAAGGWVTHNNQLPNVPISCIVIDTTNGTTYIGTEVGVFYSTDGAATWNLFDNNMPTVPVTDLGINYTTNEIWASTYGRGIWKSTKYGFPTGISMIPLANNVVTISPNPNHGRFTVSTSNKLFVGNNVQVRLIDSKGTNAWTGSGAFSTDGKMDLNVGQLPRGTYMIEITNHDGLYARSKMILL
ncbi:MAG: T9SS type A sorting domain-containing protein [Bacteroidota bacterium]